MAGDGVYWNRAKRGKLLSTQEGFFNASANTQSIICMIGSLVLQKVIVSMAIKSNGAYGVPEGLIFSFQSSSLMVVVNRRRIGA